ncbi:MAG: type II secretion system F family protein [Phycisphaerales bacterium]
MATFRYTTLGGTNGKAGGVIDAPDRPAAVRVLISRGITPSSVEPLDGAVVTKVEKTPRAEAPAKARTAGDGAVATVTAAPGVAEGQSSGAAAAAFEGGRALHGRAMSLSETASFIRELATAVQAGLPMVPALRTLAKSGRSPLQRQMLAHLIAKVEQGTTLAEACRSWGPPFSELIVNLVRAGEASGKLGEVLHQAADLLEKDVALRRTIAAATLYPAILTVLVTAAIVVMVTVIIPRVLAPLAGDGRRLPLPTRIVQGAADFFGGYWWLIVGVLVALVVVWNRLRAEPASRLAIDGMLLKVPLFGPVVRDALVARFTRTLGTLVKAGLPVLSALRLTGATLTNRAMQSAVMSVCDQVAAGKTIAGPLEAAGLFPPLLVQIVSLGERSGRLADLLTQAAGALEDRTTARVKILTGILPSILIVIVACVVGGVVAAIILPLLEMQDAIAQ